jgi:hypothetical protein
MSWAQIARAYETGWTPPKHKPRGGRAPVPPRVVTIGGESKRMVDWVRDPRNVHDLAPSTVWRRAKDPANLESVEHFFRAPEGAKKSCS